MVMTAAQAREDLKGREIWIWHYLHADWQWEQSRHWHEERYALAVQEVLDVMQDDPEFCYFFDSTSEFYSAVAQRLGPRLEELKEHLRSGRIRLVSGQVANTRPSQVGGAETFVRNLQLGREYFERHLPPADLSLFHSVDISIGSAQMPQILSLAGFKYYRAWRPHGPMNVNGIPQQFIWQGMDGSQILVTRGAYGLGWRADSPPVRYTDDWDSAVAWMYENHFRDQVIGERSPTDHLWVIQGYDDARPLTTVHADEPFDVIGLVREWRRREDIPIHWCTPLEYSQAVETQQDRLSVVEGVLDGADMSFNIGNHGAHGLWMWRQMNDRRLVDAELWAAAAGSAGYGSPREELKKLWYQHCVYQAHAQDHGFAEDWDHLVELARDVQFRSAIIRDRALGEIVRSAGGGTRLTRYIFNQHPWEVDADVELYHPCATAGIESLEVVGGDGESFAQQQLSEFRHPRFGGSINDERRLVRITLPPTGYRRIEYVETSDHAVSLPSEPEDGVLVTEDLKLIFRDHALREVHDLSNGRTYASREGGPWPGLFFHVLDNQDWVFGGPEIRRDHYAAESSEWLETGPIRWRHRSQGLLGPYRAWVDTIIADQGRELQLRVKLDGHWEEPPMTGFATLLADIEASGSVTVDVPFGVEPRDPDHDVYVNNAPSNEDLGIIGMFERLRPGIFWGRSWADWSGDRHGLSLITVDGNYYWLKEPGQFGHVLLRCAALHPGTWEEFCPASFTGNGTHEFSYALRFHDGDWRRADPQRRALELSHAPLVARADYPEAASLPSAQHSFLHIDGPAILSAYYNEDDIVFIRFYENEGQGGEVTLSLDWPPLSAELVDFLGQTIDIPIVVDGNQVSVGLKAWQIATLKLVRG